MKKVLIFITVLILMLSFSSCARPDQGLTFKLDSGGNYTGFANLPSGYTAEQAQKDGCYVQVQSKTVYGQEKWDTFMEQAAKGQDASIRIVKFYQDSLGYYDLFYAGGQYRIFDSQSSDLHDHPYLYLQKLAGRLPNAAQDDTVTILTNDNSLTYKDVMWTFLSSDSHYAETISPFKLIFIE